MRGPVPCYNAVMTFTYVYRDTSGIRRTGSIDATDRAAAFSALRARGINPLSVDAGTPSSPSGFRFSRVIILSLVLAATVAGVFYIFISGEKGRVGPKPERKKPVATENAAQPNAMVNAPKKEKKVYTPPPPVKDPPGKVKPTPDGGSIGMLPDGTTVKLMPRNTPKDGEGRRRLFSNDLHAFMAAYTVPGTLVPPMPMFSDEFVLNACMAPIVDAEDDSEDDREIKSVVREMLVELKQYLKDGKSAGEYFAALQARQNLEADAVRSTQREVNMLITEGKYEEARDTLDAYNAYLEKKNIPPVHVKRLTDYENAQAEGGAK